MTNDAEREAMRFLKSLNGYTVWNRYDAKKLAMEIQQAELRTIKELREWTPWSAKACRLCVYENGVFKKSCVYHIHIEKAEQRGYDKCLNDSTYPDKSYRKGLRRAAEKLEDFRQICGWGDLNNLRNMLVSEMQKAIYEEIEK